MSRKSALLRVALLLPAVLFLSVNTGCGAKNTLSSLQERFRGEKPVVEVPKAEVAPPEFSKGNRTVTLYFADPGGQYLATEQRAIPNVEGIARATIQELIKGPGLQANLLPTIPAGTSLKDINIRPDGLARVDFSKELVASHSGGKVAEKLTVYSIVNTLTQFPTIKQVEILVNGKYVDKLGSVSVSSAMTRNDALVAPPKK